MKLGARTFGINDKRLVRVSYRDWLRRGDTLASVTVLLPAGTASTVGDTTFSPDKTEAWFMLNCAAAPEAFDASITVVDTLGQNVTDTISFTIASPGSGIVPPTN